MERVTKNKIVNWAREHKVGTKVLGLTISQYVQDENDKIFVVVPIKDLIRKEMNESV